jgi:hypothetical protein
LVKVVNDVSPFPTTTANDNCEDDWELIVAFDSKKDSAVFHIFDVHVLNL